MSKKQTGIEPPTFGSEFNAMKTRTEYGVLKMSGEPTIESAENQADLLSKPLAAGSKGEKLVGKVLHHTYDKVNGVEYERL